MRPHIITLSIVIFIIVMIIIFSFVVIKNSNKIVSQNIKAKRNKELSNTLNSQDVDDAEKMELIVSLLYKMFGNQKHGHKKGLIAVKDKKGHYAKYEISSKENIQWKNKSDAEYKPKQLEYLN